MPESKFVNEQIDLAYLYFREGEIKLQLSVVKNLIEKFSINRVSGVELPKKQLNEIKKLVMAVKKNTPAEFPLAQLLYAMYVARRGFVERAHELYDNIHVQYPNYKLAYKKHAILYKMEGNDRGIGQLFGIVRKIKAFRISDPSDEVLSPITKKVADTTRIVRSSQYSLFSFNTISEVLQENVRELGGFKKN